MHWLSEKIDFPPYESANPDGIIALGGDLSEKRLLHAYNNGIFPWFSENEPIVWYFPKKRMVLFPDALKVSTSMRKILKSNKFVVTENKAFKQVISNCKKIDRKDGLGTWITDDMEKAYIRLHDIHIAKSVEVWFDNKLVGGLYGVKIGNIFCGESMFSSMSNASKVAFIHLVRYGGYALIDCQVYNDHLASLGACEIDNADFLDILKNKKR